MLPASDGRTTLQRQYTNEYNIGQDIQATAEERVYYDDTTLTNIDMANTLSGAARNFNQQKEQ
jgi:hypothetical protein